VEIDGIIKQYPGWKADILRQVRAAIMAADPRVFEEVKWKMTSRPLGWPVWSCNGIVCFAEVWKQDVKLIFPKGAKMAQLQHHFNARLDGNTNRAIEFHEGDAIDKTAISELITEAITLNNAQH